MPPWIALQALQGISMRPVSVVVKIAIACALPLLACSSYYTVEHLGTASLILAVAASLAIPALLLGIASLAVLVSTGRTTGRQVWGPALLATASVVLLCFVWL